MMSDSPNRQLNDTLVYLQRITQVKPKVALILGSGLSNSTEEVVVEATIPYHDIPNFPVSTVKGHSGNLVFGKWHGIPVVIMQGRFHYYEGYSLQQVTFPLRVMKKLGADIILITNASGGLNPEIKIGEIMMVTDHINLNSDHPLRGMNDESFGPRFPDQHAVYDKELLAQAVQLAAEKGIRIHQGVYVGVPGPTFETPAEYRYMRLIGGDAVGMSTVPEAIVANHMGMRIACLSVICDEGNPAAPVSITHDDVVKAAKAAEAKIATILSGLLLHISLQQAG
jgi:purine-nucleoside phosphorylase